MLPSQIDNRLFLASVNHIHAIPPFACLGTPFARWRIPLGRLPPYASLQALHKSYASHIVFKSAMARRPHQGCAINCILEHSHWFPCDAATRQQTLQRSYLIRPKTRQCAIMTISGIHYFWFVSRRICTLRICFQNATSTLSRDHFQRICEKTPCTAAHVALHLNVTSRHGPPDKLSTIV